jgi:hypothetical protein
VRDEANKCKVSPRLAGGYRAGYLSQAKGWLLLKGLRCRWLEGIVRLGRALKVKGGLSRLRGTYDSIDFVSCSMVDLKFSLRDIHLSPLKFSRDQKTA